MEAKRGSCQRFAAIDSREFRGARRPPATATCTHSIHSNFPYSPSRPYTPEPVSVEELRSLHKALHMSRVIVVQTTVYGSDNAGALDAMKKLGSRARGVAVIDEKTPDSALDEMDRAGIRGIRLNLETAGQTDPAVAASVFRRPWNELRTGSGTSRFTRGYP